MLVLKEKKNRYQPTLFRALSATAEGLFGHRAMYCDALHYFSLVITVVLKSNSPTSNFSI